nr:putative structure protein [Chaetoceros debilis associated DNA virus]
MDELIGGSALLATYGAAKAYNKLYPKRKTRFNPKPIDNQAAIKRLSRQVGMNRQEVIRVKRHTTITPVTAFPTVTTTDLPAVLIADAAFRDNILGDTWKNKALALRFDFAASTNRVRVLLLRAIKPGTVYSPGSSEEFTNIPDPNKYHVYMDNCFTPTLEHPRGLLKSFKVNFRNLITQYDTANTTLERGDIRLYVFREGGTDPHQMSFQYSVQNK